MIGYSSILKWMDGAKAPLPLLTKKKPTTTHVVVYSFFCSFGVVLVDLDVTVGFLHHRSTH